MPPDLPPPVLEVFYSPSCAPCRLELPVLAKAVEGGGTVVRIVILDQEQRAREDLRAVSPKLEAAAVAPTEADPRDTLRSAGNANGILPYALSRTDRGEVCDRWSGGLTMTRLRILLEACSRLITSPQRSRS